MKDNQTFEKFKSKLTFEAVLNSVLVSLSIGLFAGGLIALISWLCGYKSGFWIALGAGVGSAVISFPLFYFLKFRPSVKQTGRRVDELGLQERAITMLEFMDDNSPLAARQREDARTHIATASSSALKILVPAWIAIVFTCAFVFAVSFGTVSGLYCYAVVPSPSTPVDPMEQRVTVDYWVEEGGEIEGDPNQILLPGEDATTVTAVAIDGYVFAGWDDGIKSPTRTDLKITENFEVTALFEEINDGDGGEDGDFNGPATDGDSANDQPSESDESQGVDGSEGDGQGASGDSEGTGSGDQEGEGKGDGQGEGAGGKWSQGNQIIDGETYYRELLDQYYEEAMQDISSNDELSDEAREFIEAYLGSV